jgi:hypothetical protein
VELGAVYQVDQFAGADFGTKLGACLSGLSSTQGGTCDARNFTGTLAMGSSLVISTANATVLLPCATISTASQLIVTAGTRNVSLRGCALRGASTASGSQGGTVFYYSGAGAMVQVGDPTYAADTLGFHLDNAVINITAASSASAQGFAAYRTQELDLESLYFLGNANQTGMTLDGTGNYTGGSFYDNEFTGFQTAVNAIGHQVANAATTDWVNASTFLRVHIDCPTSGGSPISGTYGINLQQGDGNTFTGGDVEGCSTALHLGANAQNNTIVGLRNENSTNQVVADAGSSYNDWMTGGTMFTGELTDNGTRNSFLDTFHRSFNGLNGDWYGSQKDATVTNHYRLGTGAGNERGLLNEIQTDYGYRWIEGYTDATAGEQFYQLQDLFNNVNRISVGQYNHGQSSTNNQTVINAAGTGAVVLNGSNNSGTGGVVIGSGGASETTVATISNAGNAQFNGTLQVGGTSTFQGTTTAKNQADAEIDATLWAGLTAAQNESFIYKNYLGASQWYMENHTTNDWSLTSAVGGLDSFKAYQSTNTGDTYINTSNSTGVVRINYETGSGTQFKVYGGNGSSLYASFTGTTSIQFPGLAASSGHNCLQVDNSGYVTNTGAACGVSSGGGGTVNAGTTGQIAYYSGNGTAVSGENQVTVVQGGTGATTAAAALANLGGAALAPAADQNILTTNGKTKYGGSELCTAGNALCAYTLPGTVMQTNADQTFGAHAFNLSSSTLFTQPAAYTVGAYTITNPGLSGTLVVASQLANFQVNLSATQTGSGSTGTAAFPGNVATGSSNPLPPSSPCNINSQWASNVKFITPQMCGAAADGTTDDSAAIAAAIAAVSTNGGTVFFPRGTYNVLIPSTVDKFTLPAGVVIQGEGRDATIITSSTKAGGHLFVIPPNSDARIQDMYLQYGSVLINGAWGSKLENLYIYQPTSTNYYGLEFEGAATAITINDVQVRRSGVCVYIHDSGSALAAPGALWFRGLDCEEYETSTGVYIQGAVANVKIDDSIIEGGYGTSLVTIDTTSTGWPNGIEFDNDHLETSQDANADAHAIVIKNTAALATPPTLISISNTSIGGIFQGGGLILDDAVVNGLEIRNVYNNATISAGTYPVPLFDPASTADITLALRINSPDGVVAPYLNYNSNVVPNLSLSGTSTAPTQSQGDSSTKIATTAYVDTGLGTKAASGASTTVNGQTCTLGSSCTVGAAPNTAINLATSGAGGVTGQLPNANLANVSVAVNGQTCALGSTCTIPIQTNGAGNTSQGGINLSTSTTNSVGLTVTPTNSSTNVEKFEITGTYSGNISFSQLPVGTASSTVAAGNDSRFAAIPGGTTSGWYYASPTTSVSTATRSNGTIYISPIYINRACTISNIGLEVTSAGSSGSVIRLGIYNSDSTGQPTTLLVDAGTIDGTNATVQFISVNRAVSPGVYWLAAVEEGSPSTLATVRTNSGITPFMGWNVASVVSVGTAMSGIDWVSGTTGALPSSFMVGATSGSVPRVMIEIQ